MAARSQRSRRSRRLASVVALVAGLLPGAHASAGTAARLEVEYTCGTATVQAEITADFPAEAVVGEAIQPENAELKLTVPKSMQPANAATLAGRAALTMIVTHGGASTDARWSELGAEPTAVPDDGGLTLTHRGDVPPVTPPSGGTVTFVPGPLLLELTAVVDGVTSEPSTATCRPAREGSELASVEVSDPAAPPTPAEPEERNQIQADQPYPPMCPPPQTQLTKDDVDFALLPPGTTVLRWSSVNNWSCAYAGGFANQPKLNGALTVNDPRQNPEATRANYSIGTMRTPHGFAAATIGETPPVKASGTFLAFGFMPIIGNAELTTRPVHVLNGRVDEDPDRSAWVAFDTRVRLIDQSVNGVVTDVGPRCRTAKPFRTNLVGVKAEYPNVTSGGLLRGTVDVPAFQGCRSAGEDVDPLINALAAGPGSYIVLNQGHLCTSTPTSDCMVAGEVDIPELPPLRGGPVATSGRPAGDGP